MSSSDGIYILQTFHPNFAYTQFKRLEYRVGYCIEVDNLWYVPCWDTARSRTGPDSPYIRDGSYANLLIAWRDFRESRVFHHLPEARQEAQALLKSYRERNIPCEYDISTLVYHGVFPTPSMVAATAGNGLRRTLSAVALKEDAPVKKSDLKDFYQALSDFTDVLPRLFSNEFPSE